MTEKNKKKKILYCITKASWGGAQKYVFDLATALDPALFEVAVVLGGEGLLVERLKETGVRVIQLNSLSRDISILKDIVSFFKLLKIFHQEKPDIVHLNSSKIGLLGALAGRILFIKKIIFTGHGWAFNEDRSKWQKKIIYFLHRLTVSLSHYTVAVSLQTRSQILPSGKIDEKIIVIKNGISEIEFLDRKVAREKLCEKINQINQGDSLALEGVSLINRTWLGTISELHKNKGLKYLIEAIHILNLSLEDKSLLPILVIVGEGERRQKLEERIRRYGLDQNIFLVGRIEQAEKYLQAFDIFTLTSITEALPYVLLEAGQAGLPIIATSVGGVPEIIEDMKSGILVRPKEPEEIRQAIEFLVKNKDKAEIFSQNIKNKIQTDFNKKDMVEKTIALY